MACDGKWGCLTCRAGPSTRSRRKAWVGGTGLASRPVAVTVTATTESGAAESGTSNHRRPQAVSFSSRRTLPSGHIHRAEGPRAEELRAEGPRGRAKPLREGRRGLRHQKPPRPGAKRWARTEQQGSGAVPGEVGGEREAGADRRPKVEILRTREAGDADAEQGPAAGGQEARGAAELRRRRVRAGAAAAALSGRPQAHLPLASHLQQDREHGAGLGGRSVQAPPLSVPADQLQREGSRGGQKRGRERGGEETSLPRSQGLQRHPAPLGTLRDPSKDHVGEMRPRISGLASGAQPCHLYQQLGLEAWDRGREGRTMVRRTVGDREKKTNGVWNQGYSWGERMEKRGYL